MRSTLCGRCRSPNPSLPRSWRRGRPHRRRRRRSRSQCPRRRRSRHQNRRLSRLNRRRPPGRANPQRSSRASGGAARRGGARSRLLPRRCRPPRPVGTVTHPPSGRPSHLPRRHRASRSRSRSREPRAHGRSRGRVPGRRDGPRTPPRAHAHGCLRSSPGRPPNAADDVGRNVRNDALRFLHGREATQSRTSCSSAAPPCTPRTGRRSGGSSACSRTRASTSSTAS